MDDLTSDELTRLATEILEHHGEPMTQDELHEAWQVLVDDFEETITSLTIWTGWKRGLFSLGVVDGEMRVHAKT